MSTCSPTSAAVGLAVKSPTSQSEEIGGKTWGCSGLACATCFGNAATAPAQRRQRQRQREWPRFAASAPQCSADRVFTRQVVHTKIDDDVEAGLPGGCAPPPQHGL